MDSDYEEKGYVVFKQVFTSQELHNLREVIMQFHRSWKQENAKFYKEKAVNSAYLTAKKHLEKPARERLFKFIGSNKLMDRVTEIMGTCPAFMNTQLFFDPVNLDQRNYWHRDPQYHLSVEEQKSALSGANVLHFRIPLMDEPGIELIPETHKRWDTREELNVRLEQCGRKNYESLPAGVKVSLQAGDLLVFSANMIHRGIYGMNRLSLDILFCDPILEFVKFLDNECLPDSEILNKLENATALNNTIALKSNYMAMDAVSETAR
ncbi:phytanoyl-CoA dioxygenase family protein [Flocculibacter collagenilyticus]|uniref:phytanoyl-CoA dioxygenase family protein n=1 Tax=Flocculibacter collagenilyticus TaxID=2744479 RepID=UPI0018F7B045|nr:phytanoyl-CoA dioxygenase family protein [Flocculibacter collagenilyticus]